MISDPELGKDMLGLIELRIGLRLLTNRNELTFFAKKYKCYSKIKINSLDGN